MRLRLFFAAVLVAIAIAWIADLQGDPLFPGGFSTWWPSLVILLGVASIFASPWDFPGGLLLVLVGAGLQLWRLDLLPGGGLSYAVPVLLLVLALAVLTGPMRARWRPKKEKRWPDATGSAGDVAVFSGHATRAGEGEYRGGEMAAVFGHLEADLSKARLPAGGAKLKATSVFGQLDLRVPEGWRVVMRGVPVFGQTLNRARSDSDGPVLDVEAVSVFGKIDVTN